MSETFYLQDTRSTVGNSALWWAIANAGYTVDIRCARVWTLEEKLEKEKDLRSTDKFWPKADIDRLVQHHIDVQDLYYKDNTGEVARFPHTLVSRRPDLCVEVAP